MAFGDDDEVELPDQLKSMGHVVDEVLPPGIIDISQEIGTYLPERMVQDRVHHYFAHAGLGYKYVNEDTFKLRVRSRTYPLFGKFTGKVNIYRKVPFSNRPQVPDYAIEGVLQFRPSVSWCLMVFALFGVLVWLFKPGAVVGWGLFLLGSGLTLLVRWQIGRSDREEAEDQIERAFLLLRTSLQNIR